MIEVKPTAFPRQHALDSREIAPPLCRSLLHLIHPSSTDPTHYIPNSIKIQSAVLTQYTLRTDRLTDRRTDRHMGLATGRYQVPLTGSKSAPVCTGRIYGPYIRVVCMGFTVTEPSVSVAASVVCRLLSVYPRQISKTTRDTRQISSPCKKSGSESKNITSDFAPEIAK